MLEISQCVPSTSELVAEMHVQPRAPRAPARLTAARSPRPPAASTGKPRGPERLSGGRSTGAVTLQADLTLGI